MAVRVLVTGSNGLIGSEAVAYFDELGADVVGVDNNMRAVFFGPDGDTRWNQRPPGGAPLGASSTSSSTSATATPLLASARRRQRFDLIVHCAAQPSPRPRGAHAVRGFRRQRGRHAEHARRRCAATSPRPCSRSRARTRSTATRPTRSPSRSWRRAGNTPARRTGTALPRSCRIDRCLHSLFGASKVAADVMAQEYGKYFGLKIGVFRGGCLTGPQHSGVELHGFSRLPGQVPR